MSRCEHCGAWLSPIAHHCESCGTERRHVPIGDPIGQALERLAASSEYASAKAQGPRRPAPGTRDERTPWALILIFAMGTWSIVGGGRSGVQSGPFLPLIFMGLVAFGMFRRRQRRLAYRARSLDAQAAHVSGVDPWQDPGQRSPLLAYLQFSNGDRRRLRLPASLPLQLKTGDYGVAYFRGDVLVDFRRLSMGP